jgi:hypothetical protein
VRHPYCRLDHGRVEVIEPLAEATFHIRQGDFLVLVSSLVGHLASIRQVVEEGNAHCVACGPSAPRPQQSSPWLRAGTSGLG